MTEKWMLQRAQPGPYPSGILSFRSLELLRVNGLNYFESYLTYCMIELLWSPSGVHVFMTTIFKKNHIVYPSSSALAVNYEQKRVENVGQMLFHALSAFNYI